MAELTPEATEKTVAIFPEDGLDDLARLGGKGAALARLMDAFAVPAWFAVPGDAGADLTGLKAALMRLDGGRGPYAVRSSAGDEDGRDHSFAGQLDSFLEVAPTEVAERIQAVRASAGGERVRAYRREQGLSEEAPPPTVLVQCLVRPQWAGVAFSADPVSGRRGRAVVAAVAGLGEALVAGETSGETRVFDRDEHCVEADADSPLPEGIAREAARLARRAEAFFGAPQDIEWAWADGHLWLLQSRPITTLADLADPDARPVLWDNSNIAESYAGVTTPATFSFARYVYAHVYRQFCHLLRVPDDVIAAHQTTFEQLLGLVRGRLYYNLFNWYRCLALLPGFRFNRPMMEQMMGVDRALEAHWLDDLVPEPATRGRRWADGLRLITSLGALVVRLRRLPRDIDAFRERLDAALATPDPTLAGLRPDELVAHYRDLETRLLTRWDAPLVNDFFAMIFHGLLGRLCQRWVGAAGADLHNTLLVGESGIISTEPARRVAALARQAALDPDLVAALRQEPARRIRRRLENHPEVRREVDDYLARFGDRCVEELKLESRTLNEDPLPLYRAIGARAAAPAAADNDSARQMRVAAEAELDAALKGHPLRRWVMCRVLRQARQRVRDRENLRFERTRLFGRVRRVLIELGKRYQALGRLEQAEDVFWLNIEETLGFVEGTTTSADLAGLAAARRHEFVAYREAPAPDKRFVTRGPVHAGQSLSDEAATAAPAGGDGDQLSGTPCCAGVVRGRARVVLDPRDAELAPGDILVAEHTDPGWILLLSAASAVVVEHGSLLSHAAIVARELGIPALVAVRDVTTTLRDGETIEVDGAAGTLRRLDREASA